MAKGTPGNGPEGTEQPGARLDSWKEIAAYLKRETRTVRRWEKAEGLPVHRHLHTKRGTVYAYTGELEAWWGSRRPGMEEQEQAQAALRRRRMVWVVAASLLAVALVLGSYLAGKHLWRPARPPAGRSMLAVLPFDNLSGDPEQEYFSDGLTEEMIAQLGQLQPEQLGVIARTSAMQYKGTKKGVREIGRELGVNYVLEGTVRRAGGRVRVSAQLIQVTDQTHLWAGNYERDLQDVLALQGDVARAIAHEIRVKLTPEEHTRLVASARPINPEAYELYLRGRFHAYRRTPEALQKAQEYFRAAIDADPGYALGYVGLADSYRLLVTYAGLRRSEGYPRAKAALTKALEIDDSLAEAHASLAQSYDLAWDWEAAEREYRRSFELDRNYSTAHHWYALHLSSLGRHEEAIREIKRARELDPLSPIIRGAEVMILFYDRKYDETIKECQKALELDPTIRWFHGWQGAAYLEKGIFDQGVAGFERYATMTGTTDALGRVGYAYARAGRRGEALKIARELEELSRQKYVSSYSIALVYVGLGEKSHALSWLEKAYKANEEANQMIYYLKVSPWFDSLRSDPRFKDLLQRMNFPQ